MNTTSIKLRLVLTSSTLSPDQISARAGIMPTKTWRIGDVVHPRAANRHKENGCTIEVHGTTLSAIAEQLVNELQRQSADLTNLTGIDIELSCVVNIYDSAPELHLEPNFVAFAAGINAAIDFDVYVLSSAVEGA